MYGLCAPEQWAERTLDAWVAVKAQAGEHALKRQLVWQCPAEAVVRQVHLAQPG